MSEQGGEKPNGVSLTTNGVEQHSVGEGHICSGGDGAAELSNVTSSALTTDLTTLPSSEEEASKLNNWLQREDGEEETHLEDYYVETEKMGTDLRKESNAFAEQGEPDSQQKDCDLVKADKITEVIQVEPQEGAEGKEEKGSNQKQGSHLLEAAGDEEKEHNSVVMGTGGAGPPITSIEEKVIDNADIMEREGSVAVEGGVVEAEIGVEEDGTEAGSMAEDGTEAGSMVEDGTEAGSMAEDGTEAGSMAEDGAEAGSMVEDGTEAGSMVEDGTEAGSMVEDGAEAGSMVTEAGSMVEDGAEAGSMVEDGTEAGSGVGSGYLSEERVTEPSGEECDHGWTDILGNGELLKKVLQSGQGLSTRPTQQSRVKVRTSGVLEGSKTVVDRHSAVSFTVGDGDVIQAWDIAVSLMEQGEVAQVKTSARFAYGETGKPPTIPANTAILYEVELLQVLGPVQFATIGEEELVQIVEKKKTRGNELFQQKCFLKAINSYHRGLQAVESYLDGHNVDAGNISPTLVEMLIRCQNNIAAAQLKVQHYKEALSACESVLKLEADNVKALYRAGKVLAQLGEMEQAITMLQKALQLNPEDKIILTELHKVVKKKEASDWREKEMCQRMVGGTSSSVKEAKKMSAETLDSSRGSPWPYMAIAGITALLAIGTAYFFTQRH